MVAMELSVLHRAVIEEKSPEVGAVGARRGWAVCPLGNSGADGDWGRFLARAAAHLPTVLWRSSGDQTRYA